MNEDKPGHELSIGHALWFVAVLLFGAGDALTTAIGLSMGAVELHPFFGDLIEEYVLLVIIPLKIATFCLCYVLWALVPWPFRIGVPIGLTILGTIVTVWNIYIITLLL